MEKHYTKKYAKDFNILTRLYQLYALYLYPGAFLHLFYKVKIEGFENIPKPQKIPYIYAANHVSYIDPFLVALGCRVKLAFMAKIELFQYPGYWGKYLARNIFRLGAFGVNREKPDISTFKTVKEVSKAKWSLCIFPQGGIRKNHKIEHINKGFAIMAQRMKYDIIPMSITGCEHYNWNIFKKAHINIKIGNPISHELSEDEIIDKWSEEVAKMTGYELVKRNLEPALQEIN